MNKKKAKKLAATNEDLSKTLTAVRGQLTKAERKLERSDEKAQRWKKEAMAARTAAGRSDARAKKLQSKLDRATAELDQTPDTPVTPTGTTRSADTQDVGPDQTWTVVRLRAEARARGLTGMSQKSKSQLLDALRRS